MILLAALIIVLIGIPLWLLIAPLQFLVDTDQSMVALRWKSIGQARLVFTDNDILLKIRIFFWQKTMHPLTWKKKKKKKDAPKKPKSSKKKKAGMSFKKVRRLASTFSIRQLRVDVDTDNYLLNSWLYPLFYFLNGKNRKLSVNYEGRFHVFAIIENRGYKVLRAFVFG